MADPGTGQGVAAVEQQPDRHQRRAKPKELRGHRAGMGIDELRQQHRAEQQCLGVQQIGEQPLLQGGAPAQGPLGAFVIRAQQRQRTGLEHAYADPQQIGGACQAHYVEGPWRGLEQRRQAQGRKRHVAGASDTQAEGGGQGLAATMAGAGLQQENHVGAGKQINHRQCEQVEEHRAVSPRGDNWRKFYVGRPGQVLAYSTLERLRLGAFCQYSRSE